ncbi:hypothetical protein SEA_NIGHTMARE_24 [Arthrobacter phage Nightmare]|uniref:Minor tail protein n=1 Tax=Arthrobacter phage Nightmare TaxID=2015864 RepID=A0A221J6H7_9CAUD|nr:hypothetical protein QCN33_gp24 [Arthrobacter phage Nightmare]ASM62300.1 hypothetical protein SEA_NIGHTMARE_24 [Arthrobacter phage Nightmare]
MAQTPTDPTKAQVWITKGIDDLDFEFYFPQGPKGDPGGLVNPAMISTGYDWNNLIVSGSYYAAGAEMAGMPNSPPSMAIGTNVIVQARNASVVTQWAYTVSNAHSQMQFMRSLVSGTWGPWKVFRNTNIDNSVGRTLSIWDETGNRSQLIYGDTGERDVRTELGNGTFAALKLRRVNHVVELTAVGWVATGTNASMLLSAIPLGFRNNSTRGASAVQNTTLLAANVPANTGNPLIYGATVGATVNFTAMWQTIDPWPATLPGTAIAGTTPNL